MKRAYGTATNAWRKLRTVAASRYDSDRNGVHPGLPVSFNSQLFYPARPRRRVSLTPWGQEIWQPSDLRRVARRLSQDSSFPGFRVAPARRGGTGPRGAASGSGSGTRRPAVGTGVAGRGALRGAVMARLLPWAPRVTSADTGARSQRCAARSGASRALRAAASHCGRESEWAYKSG